MLRIALALFLLTGVAAYGQISLPAAGVINTIAGGGSTNPGDGGLATSAQLTNPTAVAVDSSGNIYFSDTNANRVRKITAATGIITTVAGNGTAGYSGDNGQATSAMLNSPGGVAVDSAGNIYIVDGSNFRIRKITISNGVISTVAGTGTRGYNGDAITATTAELGYMGGVAIDSAGNIYISDAGNERIRKVTVSTGIITTVAGDGIDGFNSDGRAATSGGLNNPGWVAVDSSGNIYISDEGNYRVRKVTVSTGLISTVAGNGTYGNTGNGGPATSAEIGGPAQLAADASGNIFIADSSFDVIHKVTAATGQITTVAGNGIQGFSGDGGIAVAAEFYGSDGVAVDSSGNIYIADFYNARIRAVGPSTPVAVSCTPTSVIFGSGTAVSCVATVIGVNPTGTVDWSVNGGFEQADTLSGTSDNYTWTSAGNAGPYVIEAAYSGDANDLAGFGAAIAKISQAAPTMTVSTSGSPSIYGSSVTLTANLPSGASGTVTFSSGTAGSGTGLTTIGSATISGTTAPLVISTLSAGANNITAYWAGNSNFTSVTSPAMTQDVQLAPTISWATPAPITYGAALSSTQLNATVGYLSSANFIYNIAGNGATGYLSDGVPAPDTELGEPQGVAVDSSGNVYIADSSTNRIRKVTASTGLISTVAGNGTGGYNEDGIAATSAELSDPEGVALDSQGNIYIADKNNNRIRKVTVSTGIITTVAGNGTYGFQGDGSAATGAEMRYPMGIAVDTSGNIYFGDTNNYRIRKVTASNGIISTIAGTGTEGSSGNGVAATSAEINSPYGLTADASGNIYIADTNNNRVRKVTASTGIITTVAGNGTYGYNGDGIASASAELGQPEGVAVDSSGNIYIADSGNERIREVSASTGLISTFAGNGYVNTSTGHGGYSGDDGSATSAELSIPSGVAVDAAGDIFIADELNSRIRMVSAQAETFNVPGSFAYTPTFGAIPQGGAQTLSTTFTPTDTTTYATVNASVTLQVNALSSTISVGTSGSPTTYGGPVTFTATVSSGASGTVTFYDGNTAIGTGTISGTTANFVTSSLSGGAHTITASWPGNSDYTGATSGPIFQQVSVASSTISVGTSGSPSIYGGSVTFTATLPSGASGTVTFYDANTSIGTGTISGTTATFTTSSLTAGSHSITAGWTGNTNYTGNTSSAITQGVSQATPTVTWPTATSISYGQTLLSSTLSGGSAVNGGSATVIGSFAFTTPGTMPGAGTASQSVTFTPTDKIDYTGVTSTVNVTVNPASVTITASSPTVTYGAAIPTITPGYSAFQNSETSAVLTTPPVCVTAYTTTSAAGSSPSTSCSGAAAANYTFSYVNGTVTVSQASQTINFTAPATPVTYGASAITLSATATSGLAVSFGVSGQCSVLGSTLSFTGAGNCQVTASQTGNTNYTAATPVPQNVVIQQASVTITASSPSLNYGSAVPTIAAGYSAFQNSETSAVLTTPPVCVTAYTTTSPVGSSPSTSCSGAAAANYTFSYVNGTVTVSQTSQTINFTAPATPVTYGASAVSLSASATSGLAVSFGTSGPCSVSSGMLSFTGAGACQVTASQSGNTNYTAATPVPQSILIQQASVIITASSPTVSYGAAVPTITPGYSAFQNSQTSSVLTAGPVCVTAYTTASNAGSSPSTSCSGAAASNYTFTYASGNVTVNPAPQTINFTQPASPLVYPVASPIALVAIGGNSGNPVTFSVTGPGTLSGINNSTLTITGAGNVVVTANQAGNANYQAATSVSYTIVVSQVAGTVNKPTITPGGGAAIYSSSTSVTVTMATTTAGATIYYTTDGSTPSATHGTVYTAPFVIPQTAGAQVIKVQAMAAAPGLTPSAVVTANYHITAN
jgi:hypothetical protein